MTSVWWAGPLPAYPGSLMSVVLRPTAFLILVEGVEGVELEEAHSFFGVATVEEPGVWGAAA